MWEFLYRYCWFLFYTCPSCDSAWSGGCPNPEERGHCLLCGDGKLHEQGPPGVLLRLPRFIRNQITNRNRKADKEKFTHLEKA